jgi:hypothetical protein
MASGVVSRWAQGVSESLGRAANPVSRWDCGPGGPGGLPLAGSSRNNQTLQRLDPPPACPADRWVCRPGQQRTRFPAVSSRELHLKSKAAGSQFSQGAFPWEN